MYYTGIDLHKKTSFITTIDETGKIVSKGNFKNIESDILDYFMSLTEAPRIVIESMASWYCLYDLLTGHGFSHVFIIIHDFDRVAISHDNVILYTDRKQNLKINNRLLITNPGIFMNFDPKIKPCGPKVPRAVMFSSRA